MKSPIPLLLVLGLGGVLMSMGQKKSNPIESDEIPESLDYNDPELHKVLSEADEDEESEEEND